MPHTRLAVAVGAVAFSLFAGCQPAAPPPSPSPTVVATGPNIPISYECTPEFGGAAKPCTKAQHAAMKKKDALYAEAERVYRAYVSEDKRLYQRGALIGPEMKALTAGSFLTSTARVHREARDEGYVMQGGEFEIEWVKRLNETQSDSDLALRVCLDTSSTTVRQNGETVGPGAIIDQSVFFRKDSDNVKIWAAHSVEVTEC